MIRGTDKISSTSCAHLLTVVSFDYQTYIISYGSNISLQFYLRPFNEYLKQDTSETSILYCVSHTRVRRNILFSTCGRFIILIMLHTK